MLINIDDMRKVVHQLREKEQADLIVVISHMGLPLDIKAASCMEGIDIILSGHSHDRIDKPIRQNNTWIVQSGASASFLGRIDISFENGKITHIRHQLIPLYADEYEEDPEFSRLIREIKQPYETLLREEIGKLKTPLHRMFLNETPMDRLITDAYLYAIDADIALSHGWRYGAPILPGSHNCGRFISNHTDEPGIVYTRTGRAIHSLKPLKRTWSKSFPRTRFRKVDMCCELPVSSWLINHITPKDGESNIFSFKINRLNRMPYTELSVPANKSSGNISPSKSIWEVHAHEAIRHFFQAHQTIEIHDTPRIFMFSSDVHKPRQPYSLDQSSSSVTSTLPVTASLNISDKFWSSSEMSHICASLAAADCSIVTAVI